jgi:antitoxin VapB
MRKKPSNRTKSSSSSKSRSRGSGRERLQPKARAKVFWTGRSQAIRLPKEFRFAGEEVLISRDGDRVILEPDSGWPPGFFEWLLSAPLPADFEVPSREGPARSSDVF